jgi:hypothetical protein
MLVDHRGVKAMLLGEGSATPHIFKPFSQSLSLYIHYISLNRIFCTFSHEAMLFKKVYSMA